MGRGNAYVNLDSNIVQDVMKIAEDIEKERQNPEVDEKKIVTLMYQQLLKGMQLNTGYGRNYKPY